MFDLYNNCEYYIEYSYDKGTSFYTKERIKKILEGRNYLIISKLTSYGEEYKFEIRFESEEDKFFFLLNF